MTEDIERFWEAFDAAGPDVRPEAFQERYLARASPGLRDFIRLRIGSADKLAETVRGHHGYYASVRASTLRVRELEPQIREAFARLRALYPEATFPDVYFTVGRLNSGGTTSERGLLIGVEMYGLTDDAPRGELNAWLSAVLRPVEELPHLVAHELIHFQQPPDHERMNLLEQSLREGSADFLAELISGRDINEHVHAWAEPREAELWREFRERMHSEDVRGWLYDGDASSGRPADLGYWMGYKIARAYYERAADKRQAVHDILTATDADAFLAASGYAPR
ncbi:hypothetical protein JY651_05185 [Pyxidicoccus parkwayensis]|uniref:DUF2268 domain-containing protein n=1 Tax=Pyxidicoccus parkwayensis TaxID=2813578 RepID=A0ABX7NZJ7_9BACT|nr:DUF2268 domain-containing putative Zn-dependent protease [Pyxidicoccus parkwaysis]QSQ24360.1 hypothetical protein JY651_05185 [Pyxidicoccus parkwaysis]